MNSYKWDDCFIFNISNVSEFQKLYTAVLPVLIKLQEHITGVYECPIMQRKEDQCVMQGFYCTNYTLF